MNKNFQELHVFVEGMKSDFENHGEQPKTYEHGVNGRLYSHNGVVSYSSIKGTKKIYENPNIVKYLGFCAFKDELIIFVKAIPSIVTPSNGTVTYIDQIRLLADSFSVEIPFGDIDVTIDLSTHIRETTVSVPVFTPVNNPYDFEDGVSCDNTTLEQIDYSDYYIEDVDFDNLAVCPVNATPQSYENNKDFIDVIISLTKDSSGIVQGKTVWMGYQNWPLEGKIVTVGIDENTHYKRIYYTDYVNVFRTLNLKDKNLAFRQASEFENFQNGVLLRPEIDSITNDGQIKASTCFYTYRLITANGQVSVFSPFSKDLKILKEETAIEFQGGNISEQTNKKVNIKINVPEHARFNEVECIAVEYEAKDAPTAIRRLGVKPAAEVVYFEHFGNEREFDTPITISDLTERNNTWKYCSDIAPVKNRLYAAGLRNEPVPTVLNNLSEDFMFHGWDIYGNTHNCLINPKPWQYRYFDPTVTDPYYFVSQKLYNSINVFGNFTITMRNRVTMEYESFSFSNNEITYVNFTLEIYTWIASLMAADMTVFESKFPNLTVSYSYDKMLFAPTDPLIPTNMEDYVFEYNISQVVEDIDKKIEFLPITVDLTKLVYGAVSLGYNQGNGIMVSYSTKLEEVLTKATTALNTSPTNKVLDYKEPSMKRSFMKGELYRFGIQCYDKDGNELFVIPCGDLMIPKMGEQKRYISDTGNIIISSDTYKNSKVSGNKLYAERLEIRVSIRLSCEVQKLVSMYQIVYVERTEDNRTILAQGISAPLERVQRFNHSEFIGMPARVTDKWNLPFYGGPTYDGNGLQCYDANGENFEEHWDWPNRVVTNRKLFYFDSPDLIHHLISDEKIINAKIDKIARLKTDHTRGEYRNYFPVTYPKFSQRIGDTHIVSPEEGFKPRHVNVSVFSNEQPYFDTPISVKQFHTLKKGQQISGAKFNLTHDISNAALTLYSQSWFYSNYARISDACGGGEIGARAELFNSSNYSSGMETTIIKGETNVFTSAFVGPACDAPYSDVRLGTNEIATFDTHALINLTLNNQANVYGGRTELAYSKNIWKPISTTIPVLNTTNGAQIFKIEGDIYVTLFIRNKNITDGDRRQRHDMNMDGDCGSRGKETENTKTGAWCYAMVIETMIEPKLGHEEELFYKNTGSYDLSGIPEDINEAYQQTFGPKNYVAKPFRFKDDPNMNNIIAASDVKLAGNFFDDWSNFRVNNFYEIDKNKGTVFNLGTYLDNLYAIQETQTSELTINQKTLISTNNGELAVKEGDGQVITGHNVVSDFGTSIRRAVVDIISSTDKIKGFSFFDENKLEFIKVHLPLLTENFLRLKFIDIFKNNPIIDTEGYYDNEYKESNIRLRTKNGLSYMISYNEIFGVFNGWVEYDNDLYAVWNNDIYAPIRTLVPYGDIVRWDSSNLHALNEGNELNFFGAQKTLKIGIIVNAEAGKIKIFPHWSGVISTNYPAKQIEIKTSMNQFRTILGANPKYRIREEIHSTPLKNNTDWADLRGKWMYLELEIESLNNTKVDIFSFVNFVRESYI